MQKIAINNCFGGFGLSRTGLRHLAKMKGIDALYFYKDDYRTGKYHKVYDQDDAFWSIPLTVDLGEELTQEEFYHALEEYKFSVDFGRDDEDLIETIETLGKDANGRFSDLKIVEIPDDIEFYIEEYDGNEWVAEKHKTWT